jgi:hypothetical protein
MIRQSITSEENRNWLRGRGSGKFDRYLRNNHHPDNHQIVKDLIFWAFPDEGKKLVMNYDLEDEIKKLLLVQWLVHSPQITCLILGDQRMGKDALVCRLFDDINSYCDLIGMIRPRIVTLGNVRCPPFVKDEDMYFSFKKLPFGTAEQPVYVYCSEIEQLLPARETQGPENKLFSILEGTLAQNHQKLFGCVKLASKVDINVIRSCNCKLFKFITPEKLNIEGIERNNFLSELGMWLLPKDVNDKKKTLIVFNDNLMTVNYDLPTWWSTEYSEQFRDVPLDKIWDYVEGMKFDKDGKLTYAQIYDIQTAIFQRFRKDVSKEDIIKHLYLGDSRNLVGAKDL